LALFNKEDFDMRFGLGDIVAIIVAVLKVFGLISISWWAIIGWWFVYFIASLIFSLIVYAWKE
jgi:hypothetical protein